MNVSNVILKRHGIQRGAISSDLRNSKGNILLLILICFNCLSTVFAEPQDDVLKPYEGTSVRGADPNTLTGKVMTGYQGWFNCPGDGANLGWTHWAKDISKPFAPGNTLINQIGFHFLDSNMTDLNTFKIAEVGCKFVNFC